MIGMEQVSKRYGAHQALENVSFQAAKGQVLGLLGQNGAGKIGIDLPGGTGVLRRRREPIDLKKTPVPREAAAC